MTGNLPFSRPYDQSARFDFEMLGGLGRVEPFDGFYTHRSSFAFVEMLPREVTPDQSLAASQISGDL